MSVNFILKLLFPNGPYFLGATEGLQGRHVRHFFIASTIHKISKSNSEPKILEIGSWTGSSVLTWSQAIAKFCPGGGAVLCVDPWIAYFGEKDLQRGHPFPYQNMNASSAIDLSYNLFLHNTQFAASEVKINHIRGTSSEILPYLASESFDIVYLDGGHNVENVRFDIAQADRLLKDGGILCGDDLELKGNECDLENAKAYPDIDFITDPKTGTSFHPGVTVAVHEIFPDVSAYCGYWLMQKIDGKYLPVDLNSSSSLIPSHYPEDYQLNMLKEFKAFLDESNLNLTISK
jgi:SAM-dependent methyltransferase